MSHALKKKRRHQAQAQGLVLGKRRRLAPEKRGAARSFHVQPRKKRSA